MRYEPVTGPIVHRLKGQAVYEPQEPCWWAECNAGWHIQGSPSQHLIRTETKKNALKELKAAEPCNCGDCLRDLSRQKKKKSRIT